MYEGDIKTITRPQKFYRAGTPPPPYKISGSASGILMENMKFFCFQNLPDTLALAVSR